MSDEWTYSDRAYQCLIYLSLVAFVISGIVLIAGVVFFRPGMLLVGIVCNGISIELGWHFIDRFALTNGLKRYDRTTMEPIE